MAKRKLNDRSLIKAIEVLSPPRYSETERRSIEGLMHQVCTRIRNKEPVASWAKSKGYRTWDHVLIQVWRQTAWSGKGRSRKG